MMWLTREQARVIVDHARAEAPNEACGVIAGRGVRAQEIIPIPNVADDPLHAYHMDERRLVETLVGLERRSLELLAFYHSHPRTDPIPSPSDVRLANYPDTPYLIVSLKGGDPRLSAWSMRYGQVTPVSLHVGEQSPPEPRTLSTAQKIAILLSALIAFILMIVLSLSLLPPAPVIPR
jgi:proteasome lid subunit RPN8/RPN11